MAYGFDLCMEILQTETQFSRMERIHNQKMAEEMLERLKALRKRCRDYLAEQQEACVEVRQLISEMESLLGKKNGAGTESANESEQDQP